MSFLFISNISSPVTVYTSTAVYRTRQTESLQHEH